MKIVKVTIQKTRTPTETGFKYPEEWDATKVNVVAYEDTEEMGDIKEYCIGIIHDDEYAKRLLSNSLVEEIDESTANMFGDRCKPQKIVVDLNLLGDVLVAMNKEERTPEEKDMLNPDADVIGINKTPKFDIKQWYPDE